MDILIATHNLKKRDEMQRILLPLGIRVVTADEIGLCLTDVEETGVTFEDNARLKAESGCRESALPCVGDDSGLEVDFLGGKPGVYSARYAGEHGNDDKNNQKLLSELSDVPKERRTARFVSCVCCVFPDGREILVRGECEGSIGFEPSGSGGFGYDPLFYVGGKSFAQLSPDEKDAISHRGRALRAFAEELKKAQGGNK